MNDRPQGSQVTNYETLLDRVISDGLAEVRETYASPETHHKRDGAIEGFEECRGKTPAELVELWKAADARETQILRGARRDAATNVQSYWRQRYKTLQIEFVCNVVSVGLVNSGQPPLLGHLPTYSGAAKYAEIVGLSSSGEARS